MRLKNVTFLNEDMSFETRDFSIKSNTISFDVSHGDQEESMDCEDYLVIPGLINAHFHSYSPLAKGLMKEMPLQDWCNDTDQGKIQQALFDYLDHELSEQDFVYLAQKSYMDMVKSGVSFVSDSDPKTPQLLSEGMNEIGIRGIIDTYEDIGDYHHQTDGNILFGSHLLEEEDMTHDELLRVKGIKDQYHPLMMTHCLENEWRANIVSSKFGKSSIDLYHEMDILDDKTVLFHCVYMSEKDIDVVAASGSSVVHCPLSNLDTGAGVANVHRMLEKGVNVCLGTDYSHTDVWELMRLTYYLLKINHRVNKYAAEDIFRMATVNGAKAYQLQDRIGQIKEGYKADLAFIKKDSDLEPLLNDVNFSTNLYNVLFYSKSDSVQHVMIDGKWIMKDRKLVTVDEEKVVSRYQQIAEGFLHYLHK
ncbi:amidohydrolase family protein [Bacillaceae bacterium SIJ1]|uniref:amidohydrolase family protein n=1 Tax=Litoribacterium kuwaitense TaxID=1398745 RepID=UPI0013ECA28D|nr:amidohydrolase family protein [Litoribacterium kuwaitense]NGP44640.1 amidohydrolase family protein [Litoribacterium kuwaitense]